MSRPSRKRENWEEREARLLKENVFDHLAYYIQVQLPEKKFVSRTTSLPYLVPKTTSFSPQTSRRNRGNTPSSKQQKQFNGKLQTPLYDDARAHKHGGKSRSATEKPKKHNHRVRDISSDSSSSSSSDEDRDKSLKKSRNYTTHKTRNMKRQQRSQSSYPRRNNAIHHAFYSSPYAAEAVTTDIRKFRTAESMRRQAERVAANTSSLLTTIPLTKVIEINKYRSPTKTYLRCSSSFSEHANGMLASDKAVHYATKHEERESARKFAKEKKRKEKEKRTRRRENESSQSYARKYQKPLKPIVGYDSDQSPSVSSKTLTTRSKSSMSVNSESSESTVVPIETSSSDSEGSSIKQQYTKTYVSSHKTVINKPKEMGSSDSSSEDEINLKHTENKSGSQKKTRYARNGSLPNGSIPASSHKHKDSKTHKESSRKTSSDFKSSKQETNKHVMERVPSSSSSSASFVTSSQNQATNDGSTRKSSSSQPSAPTQRPVIHIYSPSSSSIDSDTTKSVASVVHSSQNESPLLEKIERATSEPSGGINATSVNVKNNAVSPSQSRVSNHTSSESSISSTDTENKNKEAKVKPFDINNQKTASNDQQPIKSHSEHESSRSGITTEKKHNSTSSSMSETRDIRTSSYDQDVIAKSTDGEDARQEKAERLGTLKKLVSSSSSSSGGSDSDIDDRNNHSQFDSTNTNVDKKSNVTTSRKSTTEDSSISSDVFISESRESSVRPSVTSSIHSKQSDDSSSSSESGSFDMSSMTSSLRNLIEESRVSLSSSSDDDDSERFRLEEKFFGHGNQDDISHQFDLPNEKEPYVESGGEILGVMKTSAKYG
uniref:serine-rich adhesin for platelets-like n=1 Tax=Styela clava TaxID=7725 RepID=UPI00193A3F5E|nr:serine-rich adhesin for platelets-like [Styela clava]